MEEITASWVRGRLPRRDPMGHKGWKLFNYKYIL